MKNHELIFVAFGSLGDINPLLAIAKHMHKTHKLTFVANEYFRSQVTEAGVPFYAAGAVEEQLAALESKDSTGETIPGKISRFENIIGKNFSRVYDFIKSKHILNSDIIVISHGNLSPAVPACEKYDIPLILTHYSPSHIPDNREDMILFLTFTGKKEWILRYFTLPILLWKKRIAFDIKPIYNRYRKQFGLEPIGNPILQKLFAFGRTRKKLRVPLEVALLPKWFAEPVGKELSHLKFAGFPFYKRQDDETNNVLQDFILRHGKPIVFTPGTAVEDLEDFCKEIVPICRKLGSPGIFAAKHGKEAFAKIAKADDVPLLFLEHADLEFLLPKSRCLIHHGGIGTVAQAIRAGIPQIVRPRMYDQPQNGIRVLLNGLGGYLAPSHYASDYVADILLKIEASEKHQEYISYYSQQVLQENGIDNCSALIEECINNIFYESPLKTDTAQATS